jgi:hydroxyethylthiazole kinase
MHLDFLEALWNDWEAIKEKRPIVHCLTNSVVSNFTANALLAIGASPLMSHAIEELEEITRLSSSLLLNIGTLDSVQVQSMIKAAELSSKKNIPILIDPVGAGASRLRTQTAQTLMKCALHAIVKGNPTEIISLSGRFVSSSGVDAKNLPHEAQDSAKEMIEKYKLSAVIITGKDDIVINKDKMSLHSNGSELMTKVTGTGCVLGAIIAAFAAMNEDFFKASQHAVTFTSMAGQMASFQGDKAGSFLPTFIDELQNLDMNRAYKILKVSLC